MSDKTKCKLLDNDEYACEGCIKHETIKCPEYVHSGDNYNSPYADELPDADYYGY